MADGTVYDRGHFQKREDCCGMDGAVPISGKTLRKSCQSVFTSSGACAISGVCKNRKGVVVCRHCGSFCNQAAKNSRFCAILSLPIKRTIGWLAVTTACTGTLGFFAARRGQPRCGDGRHVPDDYPGSRGLRRARVTRD